MRFAALLRPSMLAVVPALASCNGVQSALTPFGAEAETTRDITVAMTIGAAVLTIAVLLLARHAVRAPEGRLDHAGGMRVILWLGAVIPTIVLGLLLVISLPTMRSMATSPGDLRIGVSGEQFWWRVRYDSGAGAAVETANEVRVPVGRTVSFQLESPDVIHSFWIPGLAGKVDMIPGRTNDLVVRATRAGVFRGVCTEFCGLSHARMAFDVLAMEPAAFDRWLAELARPASASNAYGRELFEEYGCHGCHVIRGHVTGTPIGPDLTHFGSRRSLGAGTLPMSPAAIARFIRNPASIKPGALMPAFGTMSQEHADSIAAYLQELR